MTGGKSAPISKGAKNAVGGVTTTASGAAKNVTGTATGAVSNLQKTGTDTVGAIGRGDVRGAAKGLAGGVGTTVGGAGKGVNSTVSGVGKGVSGVVTGEFAPSVARPVVGCLYANRFIQEPERTSATPLVDPLEGLLVTPLVRHITASINVWYSEYRTNVCG